MVLIAGLILISCSQHVSSTTTKDPFLRPGTEQQVQTKKTSSHHIVLFSSHKKRTAMDDMNARKHTKKIVERNAHLAGGSIIPKVKP